MELPRSRINQKAIRSSTSSTKNRDLQIRKPLLDSPVHIGKRIYWARHDRTNRGNKLRTLLPGRTLPLRTYTDQCTLTLAVITAAITLPPPALLLLLFLFYFCQAHALAPWLLLWLLLLLTCYSVNIQLFIALLCFLGAA